MSRFGDLLGGVTPAPTPAPKAEPPAPPAPVVEAAPPNPVVNAAPLKEQLFKKSKDELEKIGRGVGIELDKRQSHSKLVVELQSKLEKDGKVKLD